MKKTLVMTVFTVVFIFILFTLILLLPRSRDITPIEGTILGFTAHYPFTYELFKENIIAFINQLLTEGGLGVNRHGVSILGEEVPQLLGRTIKIIIPALILSFTIGGLVGLFQFYFRNSWIGKIQQFFSWVLASVPDFFFYITMQFLIIKLFELGFPKFTLFGHEEPHSFIIPLVALSIYPIIHISKTIYSSLDNEANQEYVQTAKAKGLETPRIYVHMIWNCWGSILNQVQVVMLYIFTSLPIIEYLSGYIGLGYQLLGSILSGEVNRAIGLLLPFLILMFMAVILAKLLSIRLVPKGGI